MDKKNKNLSNKDIWFYAIGEGGTSIAMNGINNFAMIFYTQIVGLSSGLAGLSLSITILWDAITDPLMGYISDNTRSKYGRRHGYMLLGSTLLAITFGLIWFVPQAIKGNTISIFFYLLTINLLFRTALTIFVVPYTALGFEISSDYEGRSRIQAIKSFFNMVINFVFGAAGWILFFQDRVDPQGQHIDGTLIASNYLKMGVILAITAFILILFSTISTRKYLYDSSSMPKNSVSFGSFFRETVGVLKDKHAQQIFLFFTVAHFGLMIIAQLQIFSYIEFMRFSDTQKTFVHGSTMVGFALGSLIIIPLVKRWEKKFVSILGAFLSLSSGVALYTFFLSGLIPPSLLANTTKEINLPTILFMIPQVLFWSGGGIIIPLATSMIADASGLHKSHTGEEKDGSYSAMFSFILKASTSLALAFTGIVLTIAGYKEGLTAQEQAVAKNIILAMVFTGPTVIAASVLFLRKYPITRYYLQIHIKNEGR